MQPVRAVDCVPWRLMLPDPCLMEYKCFKGWVIYREHYLWNTAFSARYASQHGLQQCERHWFFKRERKVISQFNSTYMIVTKLLISHFSSCILCMISWLWNNFHRNTTKHVNICFGALNPFFLCTASVSIKQHFLKVLKHWVEIHHCLITLNQGFQESSCL